MHGAILGDTWGSVFETIPKYPRRLFMTPTDDTFLTCACYEFLNSLSIEEYSHPFHHFDSIYEKASSSLKKWGQKFPEPGAYSPSFLNWSKEEGSKYKVASTNGCLMRQSPIALFCIRKKLSLDICVELSRIFCYPTHKSEISFSASKNHIEILYKSLSLSKTFNKEELLSQYSDLIHPLSHWQELSSNTKNQFIWGAQESLGIAVSSIYYSQNWEDMMRFLISISGDVDTYAAISGPLAQIFYPPPKQLLTLEHVIFDNEEPRFQDIWEIYSKLKEYSVLE